MRQPSFNNSTFMTDIFLMLVGRAVIASANLTPLRAQRQGEKNSKGEPCGSGDKQQNSVGHDDGRKKHVRRHRFPVLDDNDRYQNSQK